MEGSKIETSDCDFSSENRLSGCNQGTSSDGLYQDNVGRNATIVSTNKEVVENSALEMCSTEYMEELDLIDDKKCVLPAMDAEPENSGDPNEVDFDSDRMSKVIKTELPFEGESYSYSVPLVDDTGVQVKSEGLSVGACDLRVEEVYIKERLSPGLDFLPETEIDPDNPRCADNKNFEISSIPSKTKKGVYYNIHWKTFKKQSHLVEQERIQSFSCNLCEKSFVSVRELQSHEISHSEDRPYICNFCGKSFKREHHHLKHVKIHTGVRAFCCSHCAKSFVTKYELSKHEVIHSDARPYVCTTCGKSFKRSQCLTKHQGTHTGVRPFSCDLCGKSFIQKSDLAVHGKSHSEDHPYSCSTCGKSFKTKKYLPKHVKEMHTEVCCTLCGESFSNQYYLSMHEEAMH